MVGKWTVVEEATWKEVEKAVEEVVEAMELRLRTMMIGKLQIQLGRIEGVNSLNILDGNSDEEENLSVAPAATYEELPAGAFGDPHYCLNYVFNRGEANVLGQMKELNRFGAMQPVQIVLELCEGFFKVPMDASSTAVGVNITMRELYLYHAVLTFMAYLPLPSIDAYWCPDPDMYNWGLEIEQLFQLMPRQRFDQLRAQIRAHLPVDEYVTNTDKGWQVNRAVGAVQEAFKSIISCSGEFLSVDEGMVSASLHKNPLYISLGHAKPLGGFRFFAFVDSSTKVLIDFTLDTKRLNAVNCADRSGGVCGAVITS